MRRPAPVGGAATLDGFEVTFAGAGVLGVPATGLVDWGPAETHGAPSRSVGA